MRILKLLAGGAIVLFTSRARAADTPQLDWNKPVRCITKGDATVVRVQCDGKGVCLVAPNQTSLGDPLDSVRVCDTNEDAAAYARLSASGARLVPAVAEAPAGYERSSNGRAYQTKFDLLNRFYLGAGWSPGADSLRAAAAAGGPFARGYAEMGIHISVLRPTARSRHDLRILDGSASFADLEFRGTLFAYDYQHTRQRPAYWISSFIGEPRVYPVQSKLGFGFRVLSFADRPSSSRDAVDVEIGEAHLAFNPWQFDDMYSRIRVELGYAFGAFASHRRVLGTDDRGGAYTGPTLAVRSRFSLGGGGIHFLFSDFHYRHAIIRGGARRGEAARRFGASLAYEGVLLAINDQPISVRLAAESNTRDDFASELRGTDFRFTAGLRISFGAPARVFATMPAFEDP